jgi:GNAT superfamily N-acetyltransferase
MRTNFIRKIFGPPHGQQVSQPTAPTAAAPPPLDASPAARPFVRGRKRTAQLPPAIARLPPIPLTPWIADATDAARTGVSAGIVDLWNASVRDARLHAAAQAPIKALATAGELQQAIAQLQGDLANWMARPPRTLRGRLLPDAQRTAWNSRVRDVTGALRFVRADAQNLAYQVNGTTVGLMSASHPLVAGRPAAFVEIHALATHPGTRGAGGALVERAVDMAMQAGVNGVVRLVISQRRARGAYEALGFRWLGGGIMELDPARSDKWARQGAGPWRLARHADKKYIERYGYPPAQNAGHAQ